MIKQLYYVPILKWKRGEQVALQNLNVSIKNKIRPLIEIVPIPYDFVNDQPAKTIDEHLKDTCSQISNYWGSSSLFIDLNLIDDITSMNSGEHPITYLLNDAALNNINLIPVTSASRSNEYNAAIRDLLGNSIISEVCIRLEDDSFLDIEDSINTILDTIQVQPNKCHIVIDLKYVSPSDANSKILTVPTIINNIPFINDWLSLTLTSTSFPENLSMVNTNSTGLIPRTDWSIWNNVITRNSKLARKPQFGDYAIANPSLTSIDPRFMDMSGNIRYTIRDNYYIVKGNSTKKNGFSQMRQLCQRVISHKEFSGRSFSWGDSYIYDCANGLATNGNAETWRRVGTNHHITFVVDQLSNLSYF